MLVTEGFSTVEEIAYVPAAELLAVVGRMDAPGARDPGADVRRAGVATVVAAVAFGAVALVGRLPGPTGLLAIVLASAACAGLAIVLYHNVWALDWRMIITLFGWMGLIGGATRIICFSWVKRVGEAMLDKPLTMTIGGVGWLIIAAVLCFYGYFA